MRRMTFRRCLFERTLMQTKQCFKCHQVKPLTDFYRHPHMGDGHLGKCKDCTKKDVRENYAGKRARYSEYEHRRNQTPERRAFSQEYQQRRRRNAPEKYAANNAVGNAIRDRRLFREPCEACGSANVQAHHDDYSKPLEVRWLCFKHHRALHGQVVVTTNEQYAS